MRKLLNIHPENPEPRYVERAVSVLRDGGVIVYPTDTVYGLGCDIRNNDAIERIIRIKGRDPSKPFSFICADLSDISKFAKVSDYAYRILRRFLPGAYTFVLEGHKETPKLLRAKRKTVGIRIPDHPVPLALVKKLGGPIVTTSANRSGEDVLTDPEELEVELGHEVDLILSCGPMAVTPSSVISLLNDMVEVLREGAGDTSFFR